MSVLHLLKATTRSKKHVIMTAVVFIFFTALYQSSLSPFSALFRPQAEWERFTSPHHILVEDAFKKIDDKLFVFSAFYDDITDPKKTFIRIVAIDIITREWKPPLSCHFYDKNYKILNTVQSAKVKTADMQLKRNKPIPTLTFFLCEIHTAWFQTPITFVQLQKPGLDNFAAWKDGLMKIHYQPSKWSPPLYQVAMCVQPLNFPEDKAPLFLLEWIEYYLLLGVEHITFYNYNVSQEILVLLDIYSKEGTVKVLDWPVPFPGVKVQGKISARWIAATDCAHRYRGVAKYVIAVDTDEFLVPSKKHDSFPKYFDKLWNNQNISHILFTSKFSFESFPRGYYPVVNMADGRFNTIANNLHIPTATAFFWSKQKKFVMRPDLVIESGTHFLSYPVNESINKVIWRKEAEEKGEGFYLHFRACSPYFHKANPVLEDNSTCLETRGSFQDTQAAERFGKPLVQRVVAKIEKSDAVNQMFLQNGKKVSVQSLS